MDKRTHTDQIRVESEVNLTKLQHTLDVIRHEAFRLEGSSESRAELYDLKVLSLRLERLIDSLRTPGTATPTGYPVLKKHSYALISRALKGEFDNEPWYEGLRSLACYEDYYDLLSGSFVTYEQVDKLLDNRLMRGEDFLISKSRIYGIKLSLEEDDTVTNRALLYYKTFKENVNVDLSCLKVMTLTGGEISFTLPSFVSHSGYIDREFSWEFIRNQYYQDLAMGGK